MNSAEVKRALRSFTKTPWWALVTALAGVVIGATLTYFGQQNILDRNLAFQAQASLLQRRLDAMARYSEATAQEQGVITNMISKVAMELFWPPLPNRFEVVVHLLESFQHRMSELQPAATSSSAGLPLVRSLFGPKTSKAIDDCFFCSNPWAIPDADTALRGILRRGLFAYDFEEEFDKVLDDARRMEAEGKPAFEIQRYVAEATVKWGNRYVAEMKEQQRKVITAMEEELWIGIDRAK